MAGSLSVCNMMRRTAMTYDNSLRHGTEASFGCRATSPKRRLKQDEFQ